MNDQITQEFSNEKSSVELLQGSLALMSEKSKQFAQSLLKQFEDKGSLSEKQMYWVEKLYKDTTQPKKESKSVNGQRILDMFVQASASLKRMKIELRAGEQRVVFKRAGETSKYCGSIMITDGEAFGVNKFFGIIDVTTGTFTGARDCNDEIIALIQKFNDTPEETAKEFGKLLGMCCFCMKGLRDQRSLDVGYGPKCAKNYGLAWGK